MKWGQDPGGKNRCGRATGPPQGDLPAPQDGRKGKAEVPQPTEGTVVMAKGFSTHAAHQVLLGEPCCLHPCAESLHAHNQPPNRPV